MNKNPNDNSQPDSDDPPLPPPRDAVSHLQNRRRHRSWGGRPQRRPRTPARRPQRGCLRARGQGRRHLGLHAGNRVRPDRNRSDPESGPLQRLRFAPHQPAPGGDGLPGLPVCSERETRDPRRFPGHEEVFEYLRDFSREFGIEEMVRFGREVWHVGMTTAHDRRWVVKSKRRGGGDGDDEVYDAVVICNGHYSEPRIADLPGIEEWPGKQIHSHNYRLPDPFRDQIVVLIGSAASADDISRDIARVAKEVHIASRSAEIDEIGKISGHENIWLHSMIKSVHGDGTVAFGDGDKIFADVILHCTGYKLHFPFLETNNAVTVEDNRVGPLYQHVFPPTLDPWLSFVGLPWKVVPFPQFELQSKWIAGVLSGRIRMESTEEMTADVEAFYMSLEAAGIPKRYTHQMGESQFEYDNWLAEKSKSPPIEEWREGMYLVTGRRKRSSPETYRDQWEDEDLMSMAYQDFKLRNLSL